MAHPYRDAEGPPARPCPRCAGTATLEEVLVGERAVHLCAQCRGMWLLPSVFNSALIEPDLQAALQHMDRPGKFTDDEAPLLACPICGRKMKRAEYGGSSRVIVDACRPHGIWLDAEELTRIVEYVSSNVPGNNAERPARPTPKPLKPEELRGLKIGKIESRGFWNAILDFLVMGS
jgi:Zn-finger nucleic acid-binding protein